MKLPYYRLLKITAEGMTTLKTEWVDIVTCDECKFADKYYHCNYMTTWNNANDFCSRGERKESE